MRSRPENGRETCKVGSSSPDKLIRSRHDSISTHGLRSSGSGMVLIHALSGKGDGAVLLVALQRGGVLHIVAVVACI